MCNFKFTAIQEAWLNALESGRFKQAKNTLVRRHRASKKASYCCLGVGCVVINENAKELGLQPVKRKITSYGKVNFDREDMFMPVSGVETLNLRCNRGSIARGPVYVGKRSTPFSTLAEMNDGGMSHKEIAKFIRENPHKVFRQTKKKN